MVPDAGDLAADVVFQIFEGVKVDGGNGGRAGFRFEVIEEQIVVFEGQHAAIGVIDDDEFPGTEQVMGNDQGAEGVFGGDAAGIANDVSGAVCRPRISSTVMRASMQARTASFLAGAAAKISAIEGEAYFSLAFRASSVALIG